MKEDNMLTYNYSTMFAGKTLHLIQAKEIYDRKQMKAVVIKKETDTRDEHADDGWGVISSRFNRLKTVGCHYFSNLKEELDRFSDNYNVFLVDEAQFLTKDEVLLLKDLSSTKNKTVLCYGLKTDVNGNLFEGSAALLSHADNINEIPYLCQEPNCTEKANYHARYVDGVRDKDTSSVKIEQGAVTYKALCYKHWKSIDR